MCGVEKLRLFRLSPIFYALMGTLVANQPKLLPKEDSGVEEWRRVGRLDEDLLNLRSTLKNHIRHG